MNKQHDTLKIERLLGRFMAGESTLDEERTLADYFRTADVRPEWREYKEMFALFDGGEVDVVPEAQDSVPSVSRTEGAARMITLKRVVSGIAASIAILFGIYTYITNKDASNTPQPVAHIADTIRHCAPAVQEVSLASTTQENVLPAAADKKVAVAQAKSTIAATSHRAGGTDDSRQRVLETERIMRLLDDADNAFAQATAQCAMDINESQSQNETIEETEHETNITI